jgi:hypothetical protein
MDSTFKYAVFDASNYCGYSLCSLTIDTGYNQRTVNTAIACGGLGCYTDNTSYAAGLGMVYSYSYESDGFSSWSSICYALIYYSQNGETWGTPAPIALGNSNVSAPKPLISLFPTVNNGQFKIKITGSNYQACQLVVYDLAGREIKRTALDKSVNDIYIDGASAGMYLWQVLNEAQTLQTGKLIIQ